MERSSIPPDSISTPGCDWRPSLIDRSLQAISKPPLAGATRKLSVTCSANTFPIAKSPSWAIAKKTIIGQRRKRALISCPAFENCSKIVASMALLRQSAPAPPRANLKLILELTQSQSYFQAVVAMEDTVRGKPDPEVFLIGATRLGVAPSNCVVLEDAVAGVAAAKTGGMRCVAVRFVGHHSEEKLREAGADRVVESLKELSAQEILRLLS